MGNNNTTMGWDTESPPDVKYNNHFLDKVQPDEPQEDIDLLNYQEGYDTLGTQGQNDEQNEKPADTSQPPKVDKPKKKSKRVKKVEDYFQWDSLTQKQQDMYFDFVKTAKKAWNNHGFEDEDVEKVCLDRIALLRFCIARDFNPDKTFNMWIKWVEWRLDYQPHKIRRKDIKKSTFNECFYINKENTSGCPCILIRPGLSQEVYDIEVVWKIAAYSMEKAIKKADKNGSTQICVIFDRTGMNNKIEKKWLPIYKELSTLIQDYYPERLHQAYVMHMNWFARMMYNVCKPFIAKKTRNKVISLVLITLPNKLNHNF